MKFRIDSDSSRWLFVHLFWRCINTFWPPLVQLSSYHVRVFFNLINNISFSFCNSSLSLSLLHYLLEIPVWIWLLAKQNLLLWKNLLCLLKIQLFSISVIFVSGHIPCIYWHMIFLSVWLLPMNISCIFKMLLKLIWPSMEICFQIYHICCQFRPIFIRAIKRLRLHLRPVILLKFCHFDNLILFWTNLHLLLHFTLFVFRK